MLQPIPKFAVMAIAKDWGVEQISNTEFPRSFYTKILGFRQRGILQSTVAAQVEEVCPALPFQSHRRDVIYCLRLRRERAFQTNLSGKVRFPLGL